MGLITVNRIKANGTYYFIVCQDLHSALGLAESLAVVVGNEFVNVLEFKSREELLLYCESKIMHP